MKRMLLPAIAALAVAVPVEAQLYGFPDYSTPSAYGMPSTFVAASYGRGLNDGSGKADAYGAFVGRSGLGNRVTVLGGVGMVDGGGDSEVTFGGAIGLDVLPGDGSAQVSVQAGIGYMNIDPLTFTRFPIGVALKTQIEGPTATVTPWIMPKINIDRVSANGTSASETNFGASGGFSVTLPGGFGAHSALDFVSGDLADAWTLGVGVHYVLP